jgi:hypothetical protein
MPNPNVIVDTISHLDPPLQTLGANYINAAPTGVTVHFRGRHVARLDQADVRATAYAEILDNLRQINAPVYVEIDPATRAISRLLIPITSKVLSIISMPSGEVEIELDLSNVRHVLKRTNQDFDQLLSVLQSAHAQGTPAIVTKTDDEHEIIDARPALIPFVAEPVQGPAADSLVSLVAITSQRVKELFDLVSTQTCDPNSVSSPCIPFLYPDDGCAPRAHQMCRLMIAVGEQPRKAWNYGRLHVDTKNNPLCETPGWHLHVAPMFEVSSAGATEIQIIDPALFSGPVSEAEWRGVQHDPSSTLIHTDAAVFYRYENGNVVPDPTYSETEKELVFYRTSLMLRVANYGPPPFTSLCP